MRRSAERLAPIETVPLLRWVAPAAVVFGVALLTIPPLSLLGWGSPRDAATGLVATAVLAAPYARLLAIGAGLARVRWAVSTFVVLASATIATTFLLPGGVARLLWLPQFSAVAVAAAIVFGGWAGAAVSAAFVVVPAAASTLVGASGRDAVIQLMQVSWRAATVLAVVWLASALRILQASREELVEQTKAAEQARMGDDLQRTVGAALADLARRGDDLVQHPDVDTEARLRALVAEARLSLVNARRIIRSYQATNLAEELRTAAALLGAAGIPTAVRLDVDPIAAADVSRVRSALRDAVRELLALPVPPRTSTIIVERNDRSEIQVVVAESPSAFEPSTT